MTEVWFYSGTYMQDGKEITIAAYSPVQFREFVKKGLRHCDPKKAAEVYAAWAEDEKRRTKIFRPAEWKSPFINSLDRGYIWPRYTQRFTK